MVLTLIFSGLNPSSDESAQFFLAFTNAEESFRNRYADLLASPLATIQHTDHPPTPYLLHPQQQQQKNIASKPVFFIHIMIVIMAMCNPSRSSNGPNSRPSCMAKKTNKNKPKKTNNKQTKKPPPPPPTPP